MQTRGVLPELNAGLKKSAKKKEKSEFDFPYMPGKAAFPMRRQPAAFARRNPKSLAARRSMSHGLNRLRKQK